MSRSITPRIILGLAVTVAAVALITAGPARADDDGEWRHHHHWHGPDWAYPGYAYPPPPTAYYRPAPVYTPPPRVYYAPPPYAYTPPPPPVVYAPGVAFGFSFR